jgi:hypothetical protein
VEITNAARSIAREVASGAIDPDSIDEALISSRLYTADITDPDLIVRTSGEMRISNFLLWQCAYSEFYVTDVLWPDFDRYEFLRALLAFPVDRGHNDLNAVRTSLKILADGHILGVFPQGTRSKDNSPTPMLNGVSMIALRAGKPVIPVYIGGPYRLFRKTPLRIGKPVDLSDFGRRMDGETLNAATRRIEQAVWAMKDER